MQIARLKETYFVKIRHFIKYNPNTRSPNKCSSEINIVLTNFTEVVVDLILYDFKLKKKEKKCLAFVFMHWIKSG